MHFDKSHNLISTLARKINYYALKQVAQIFCTLACHIQYYALQYVTNC